MGLEHVAIAATSGAAIRTQIADAHSHFEVGLARGPHVVRYHGILGPAAKDRAQVVPRPGPVQLGGPKPVAAAEPREIDPGRVPRLNRLPWAVLLRRAFLVDVLECPKCGGRMKIIAAVTRPASVRRILDHLGLPSEAPELHPARPPPQLEMERAPAEAEDFHADPPGPDW